MMISTAFTCAPAGVIEESSSTSIRANIPTCELNILICGVGMVALLFARMLSPKTAASSV